MFGLSNNELGLVALLFFLSVVGSKVGQVGEAIGRLFRSKTEPESKREPSGDRS